MSNNNEFSKSDIHGNEVISHLEHINREFSDGFEFLKKYPKSVTVFGSSLAKPEDEAYKKAEELSARIVRDIGYTIITGGGPGIMEASNKGAYEAGGVSLGLNVSLPHERTTNAYVTHSIKFSYFFSRKTMLMFAAEAFVFFPGGYGTLDELFNVLTLIQTGKIPKVPIILFDSNYWNPFKQFLTDHTMNKYHAIDQDSLNMFEITDSLDKVIEIIKKAPVSEWWRNIN
ncbi:MAG: TIGR00730 family Rossman fold protein [Candidatus Paceibacterota bacterium]|jgi:hypothetical protein